jgi:hypothetical protein
MEGQTQTYPPVPEDIWALFRETDKQRKETW